MGDLVQNIGIFFCIGAIILIALAFFGIRALLGGRDRDRRIERGPEQPRYDDRDIDTAGGFGMPATGGARDYSTVSDRDRDGIDDDLERRRNIVDRDRDGIDDDLERRRRRAADDDDQIRSGGGFGS